MLKIKKILILLVVLLLVLGMISLPVNASSDILDLDGFLNSDSTPNANDEANTVGNEVSNSTSNTQQGGQVVQPNSNRTNTEATNSLPQTGVTEDITVMFFIVVCVILAIYAYKKIRDYKS